MERKNVFILGLLALLVVTIMLTGCVGLEDDGLIDDDSTEEGSDEPLELTEENTVSVEEIEENLADVDW